mgnify:CR=1 FL=1
MNEQATTIQEIIKAFLGKMTVEGEVEMIERTDSHYFTIKTREAGILIGDNGQNLSAINHLVKKMAEKAARDAGQEPLPFLLDVNDYQAKKIDELKNLARMQAQRVRYFKKDITMDPMNAYERRIVHAALTEYPDIKTESVGDEPERRVVIKTISEI